MRDDSRPGREAVAGAAGMTPGPFPRLFIAGEDGSEARRDAAALATALAARAEAVTVAERADLLVTGSPRDGAPAHAPLDPSHRALLEGTGCPVTIAPRGLAKREDYELRRIDVGVDGGRGAGAALDLAVRLAIALDARLRLVAVAQLGFQPSGASWRADPRELERLARRLAQATDGLVGITVETELREGLPDRILLGLAREADLLVLGSRAAYGNAGRVVLGEVAPRILRATPAPPWSSRQADPNDGRRLRRGGSRPGRGRRQTDVVTGGTEITVVLADDHNVIRAGLRAMLEAEPDLRVIGEASDAGGAAKLVEGRRPDVLVLDLQMPGAAPRADVPRLRETAPATAIVVLTMQSDPRTARDLMRAGAAGFVLKQAAERNLGEAIRAAAAGGSYVDPRLGGEMAKLEADPLDDLSERELELLRLVALGHTNREIGEQLFLSVRAIEVNRAKLLAKIGVGSRPELVRFAIANRVIEPGGP